jgi:hypothetical protein
MNTAINLPEVLRLHALWLNGDPTGQRANLSWANLSGADLSGANLSGANLSRAYLSGVNLGFRSIVPAVGTFTAFKKLRHGTIAEVQIPGNAQRVGGLTGRKCRAEFVIVTNMFGATTDCSFYDPSVIYEVGRTITPSTWDNDIRIECAGGIHFFLSREEAEAYAF